MYSCMAKTWHNSMRSDGRDGMQTSPETSTDDLEMLLEGSVEEKRGPGYGIRTAVVAGFEVSNPLRRIDDLLEQARSDLVAMAAAEAPLTVPLSGYKDDENSIGKQVEQGEVDVEAARPRVQPRAERVAAMLGQVAEASAVVRGDVLGSLQKERSRNTEYVIPAYLLS